MKKRNFFAVTLVFTLLVTSVMIGCKKDKDDNNNNSTISIQNMAFSNTSLQVSSGSTVTWKNNDNEDHTVTANDGSFDSGHILAGGTYSKTFATVGTYAYHCSLHPEMTGTIIVVAGTGSGGGGY